MPAKLEDSVITITLGCMDMSQLTKGRAMLWDNGDGVRILVKADPNVLLGSIEMNINETDVELVEGCEGD